MPDASTSAKPLFDAVLTPHRSLGPRGFIILMSAVCAVSFVAGLAFFLMGAWPVVGFLGLDVLLIFLAFRANYRSARMYEHLQLMPGRLTVERVSYHGERRIWQFEPYWLRLEVDRPGEHDSRLRLTSHGRSVTVGSFLSPEEREEFASALGNALADLRRQDPLPAGC